MKRIVLGLLAIASLCFADVRKGDMVTSTGSYGCATQQAAIAFYNTKKDIAGQNGAFINGYMGVYFKRYPSCKRIISGLDLKVQKVEDWGPKGNRTKYKLIMVMLPNNDFKWTILD
jgi:hypothetical protein